MDLFIRIQVHDTVSPALKQLGDKLLRIERQHRLVVAVDKSHAEHCQRLIFKGFDPRMN